MKKIRVSSILFDSRSHLLVAVLAVMAASGGCDFFPQGHYEGNLTRTVNSKSTIQPVGVDISKGKTSVTIQITGRKKVVITKMEVTQVSSTGFTIKIPLLAPTPFKFTKSDSCFVAKDKVRIDVCFENTGFFITAVDAKNSPLLVLTADPFPMQVITPLEPSITILLSDAVDRAVQKNFQSQAEIENAFQAKKGAQEQYLNLLPHFSSTTLFNIATSISNPTSLISSIGDLAPFLLPNRWMQAKEAGDVGKAAEIGKVLMQANLVAQVEGLAYVFERDRKNLLILDQTIEWLGEMGRKIDRLEKQNSLPAGTLKAYSSIANSLEPVRSNLAETLEISRAAFSNTLGYLNPEAIDFIDLGDEPLSVTDATPVRDREDLAQTAIQRSYELQQLYYLQKAAASQKLQVWFTWLDPQGDSHANLGFATGARLDITESRKKGLQIQQGQLQSILRKNVYETVASYNKSISLYPLETQSSQEAGQQFSASVESILTKKVFDQSSIQTALLSFLEKTVAQQNELATFRVARSKMDRIQLQGFYQRAMQKHLNQVTQARP